MGACRREEYASECAPFLDALRGKELYVVLWLEAKRPSEILDMKSKVGAVTIAKQSKQQIKWLNARVATCRLDNYIGTIPGLKVKSLPQKP